MELEHKKEKKNIESIYFENVNKNKNWKETGIKKWEEIKEKNVITVQIWNGTLFKRSIHTFPS